MYFQNLKLLLNKYLMFAMGITSFGFLNGSPLTDALINYGERITADMRIDEIIEEFSEATKIQEISTAIKDQYHWYKKFTTDIDTLSGEKKLTELILEYKHLEWELVWKFLEIFNVASTLVQTSLLLPQETHNLIDLDHFSKIKDPKIKREEFDKLSLLHPTFDQAPVWQKPGFYETVTFVFFAILPDMPSKYSLFEKPKPLPRSSDDDFLFRSFGPYVDSSSSIAEREIPSRCAFDSDKDSASAPSRSRSPQATPSSSASGIPSQQKNFMQRVLGSFFDCATTST